MKKTTIQLMTYYRDYFKSIQPLLFFIFLLFICCFSTRLNGQKDSDRLDWRKIEGRDFQDTKWYELIDDPTVTFQEVQRAFYKEWEGRDYEKGQGYKQFKRWEIMMVGNEDNFMAMKNGKQTSAFPRENNQASARTAPANWTAVGPFMPPNPPGNFSGWNNAAIGRIDVIAFDPVSSTTIYVGSPNGGLWKSIDNGVNWTLLSDDTWPNHSIADITVNPNDAQNIYVATGIRDGGHGHSAAGLMKTTDGGATWTHISLSISSTRYYRLLIDPNASGGNSTTNKLLLATSFGIYHSTDSGNSWTFSTLPASGANKRIYDMEYKPGSSSIVYAASDGLLFISTDGGVTFAEMTGVPFTDADAGRIAIAVTPADPNSAYYHVSNSGFLGIYKYDGTSFSTIADGSEMVTYVNGTAYNSTLGNAWWAQVFYDWSFGINPNDANDMIASSTIAFRSRDGGNTWQYISTSSFGGGSIHVDMHAVEYNPHTFVPHIGCDGGTYQWESDGAQWNRLNNMNISEMYTLAVSTMNPDNMICGLQDNGAFYNDAGTWNGARIGDVLSVEIDPVNPNIIYSTSTSSDMQIRKSEDKGATWKALISESQLGEISLGFFSQPQIKIHPYLREVLFTGFANIHKSMDGGTTWSNISNGNIGTSFKSTLEIAPANPDYIYTSTSRGSDGGLYLTTDGGTTWSNLTWPAISTFTRLQDLTIDNTDPLHVYVAMSDNKVYESADGGLTWIDISAGLSNVSLRAIEYLYGSADELYLAASQGVFYKNGAADWQSFNTNMPFAYCFDLALTPMDNKIKVATYGRGVWESPLQNSSSFCYAPTPSISSSEVGCSSTSVTLTASAAPAGMQYQWYQDNQLITGAVNAVYVATTGGNYSVKYTGACLGYTSNMETVTITSPQTIANYQESFEQGISYVNITTDSMDWTWRTGNTPSNNTGPTGASDGNYYLHVEASGNSNKVAILESSCFKVDGGQPTLNFDYHMYGFQTGILETQISANDGMSWMTIFSKNGDQGNQWNTENIDISAYGSQIVMIRFIATVGTGFTSDIAIDNINFGSTCVPNISMAAGNMLTGIQANDTYAEASGVIESTQVINASTVVNYDAGTSITMLPGFEVKSGATFRAFIEGCVNNAFQEEVPKAVLAQQELSTPLDNSDLGSLTIYPNPTRQTVNVNYTLKKEQQIAIYLLDFSGRIIMDVVRGNRLAGSYMVDINFNEGLSEGLYQVVLQTESNIFTKKVIYQK